MARRPTAAGGLALGLRAALCAAAVLTGCTRPEEAPRPDVILVTIDTLRADHLSSYGYPRPTTPFIDSLASKGTRFENAYATSSWTAPAMASIFTGLYPRQHGVLHGFVKDQERIANQELLSPQHVTLAEMLRGAAYETFGVSSNGHLTEETGFAQGFNDFQSMWFSWSPAPNRAVEERITRIREASPYFLWVHYFDPHGPYFARQPWIGEYAAEDGALREWAGRSMDEVRDGVEALKEDPEGRRALVDLYDSEINWVDEHLKRLFEALQPGDDTLIVITSDHGEEFLDHGFVEHGRTLFEEVVRVPLILVLPRGRASQRSVALPVSNRRIMPTILDYLHLRAPAGIDASSLLPLATGRGETQPPYVYTELDRGGDWKGIRIGEWKFMCADRFGRNCYLFDLESDPEEKDNLLPSRADLGQTLGKELYGWVAANPVFRAPTIDMALDEDQRERLKSLGYLD